MCFAIGTNLTPFRFLLSPLFRRHLRAYYYVLLLLAGCRCNLDGRSLSEYFTLGGCLEGLRMVCTGLFSISLEQVSTPYTKRENHETHTNDTAVRALPARAIDRSNTQSPNLTKKHEDTWARSATNGGPCDRNRVQLKGNILFFRKAFAIVF